MAVKASVSLASRSLVVIAPLQRKMICKASSSDSAGSEVEHPNESIGGQSGDDARCDGS